MTDTIGAQKPQPDPRGILVFDSLPDAIQRAEDATQANDYDIAQRHNSWSLGFPEAVPRRFFTRAATAAEKTLLAHLGFTVPEDLITRVEWITPGVRNRRWVALEN